LLGSEWYELEEEEEEVFSKPFYSTVSENSKEI